LEESLRTDSSFSDAVNKHTNMLIRVAFSYTKNIIDAQDIVQEVFLKLLENNPVFVSDEHEKAWLIRVTVNLCRNLFKTVWSKRIVQLDEKMSSLPPQENEVLSAVLELPSDYRIVVYLFYFEQYSIKEIASILKRRDNTVGSQLYRARKLLKTKLKEDFDDE